MFNDSIDSTKKNFINYLDKLGITPATHKNYRSDLNHFTGWLILKVRSFGSFIENLTEGVPFLNKNISAEYKNYLIENNIPVKTINRRLSTLRHFSKFTVQSNLCDSDFMEEIENVSAGMVKKQSKGPVIDDFKAFLEAEKVSPNTVKNYVSDARQFLNWLEKTNLSNLTN